MKQAIKLVKNLRYKLQMLSFSINNSASIYCNNEVVHNNMLIPNSILNKKMYRILYYFCREAAATSN